MRGLKVRCLPDEPLRNACVGGMSVAENIGFRLFDRHPFTFLKALVSGRALRKSAQVADRRVRNPHARPRRADSQPLRCNVQRAVLAGELSDDVALFIASNPRFGLDFAAVAEIRLRLMEARNRGAAVLLISADLDEIFALAHRIVVISEGKARGRNAHRWRPTSESSAATWRVTLDGLRVLSYGVARMNLWDEP